MPLGAQSPSQMLFEDFGWILVSTVESVGSRSSYFPLFLCADAVVLRFSADFGVDVVAFLATF